MTRQDYELHTVLVPIQGKPASALEGVVRLAENPELHVVILRLLDELSIPSFEDQPYYDVEAWAEEFLARWVPGAASDTAVEVRIGDPGDLVVSVTHEVRADLVAIGRRRDVSAAGAPRVLGARPQPGPGGPGAAGPPANPRRRASGRRARELTSSAIRARQV